ncbi:MAG: hypothetical protein AYK19_21880 [Theionarchaea archaeon DG-70-1]|nr:MAG: hypothetical protein AYK19_21880 [Theionarchaea archaeon DG-70-1]
MQEQESTTPAYVVWTFNRWYPPKPYDTPYASQMEGLTIRACINERASGVFSINNLSEDTPLRARIMMTDVEGKERIDSHAIQICKAAYLWDRVGNITADPLVPLNDAGEILVPPKTHERFWIFIHTKSRMPGAYTGSLMVQPFCDFSPCTIPVHIEVCSLELPDQVPLSTFTWDHFEEYRGEPYNAGVLPDTRGQEDLYMEDLLHHGVNTFLIHYRLLPWPKDENGNLSFDLDFTLFDKAVNRKKGKGTLVIECSLKGDRLGLMCGLQFGNEQWDHAFTQWMKIVVTHLKEMGIAHDEVAFSFFSLNKRNDWETVDNLCHTARLVREIDPELKIFVDYGYKDPLCKFDYHTKALKRVLPLVDIVAMPYQRLQNEEELKLLKDSKKHIWTYISNHYGYDHLIHSRNLCAYGFYRLPLWTNFARQMDGAAIFSSTRWRGDPWNDWYFEDNTFSYDEATHERCTVYNGYSGPITSRRWEAWRMGIDDYKCLHMLKEAIAQNERAQSEYETLLTEACREVITKSDNPDLADQWRWRVIEAILSLRSQ